MSRSTFAFGGGNLRKIRKNKSRCWTYVVSGSSLLKVGALITPLDLRG